MKTDLKMQVALVKAIREEPSLPKAVLRFRDWLRDHYDTEDCTHYAVVRKTGRCSACGEQLEEPRNIPQ